MIYEYKNTSGIYLIKNLVSGKFYIGSAKCIYSRWHCHFSMLNKNEHYNKHLQNSFNKQHYLIFGVIEFCSLSNLIDREQFYIDSLKPSLNISANAQNTLGYKMPKEIVERKRQQLQGKYPAGIRGQNHTEQARQKISIKAKERGLHPNFKAASISANTGRKQPKEEVEKRVLRQAKLTVYDVNEIDRMLSSGTAQKDIAKAFNISPRLVARVKFRIGYYERFEKAI